MNAAPFASLIKLDSSEHRKCAVSTRRTFLSLLTALPAFGQSFSREDLLTPWLKGDPAGTERLLRASALASPRFQNFTLQCAAEFEPERGNYPEAWKFLAQAAELTSNKEPIGRREAKLRCAIGDFTGAEKAALNGHRWDGRDVNKLKNLPPISLNVLSEVCAARGMHEAALAVLNNKSSRQTPEAPAADRTDSKVLTVFSRLALNDAKTALTDAEEAVSVARNKWGEHGPRTLDALDALGAALTALGRYDEANGCFAFTLTSRKSLYKRAHHKMGSTLLHAARSLSGQGNYPHAIELAEEGLRVIQDALPAANPRTALALAKAADVYQSAGKPVEARERFESAIRVGALFLGDEAPFVQGLNLKLLALK